MLGPEGTSALLVASLVAHLPERLAVLAVEHGPCPGGDPTPQLVVPTQLAESAVGADDWPFILVVPQRVPRLRRSDVDGVGGLVYDSEHALAVFPWVRGVGFTATSAVQRRLTLACVEVLLAWQQLAPGVRVNEESVNYSLSDVGVDKALEASIAASRIEVSLSVSERLEPAHPGLPMLPVPPVAGVGGLPPHPALP